MEIRVDGTRVEVPDGATILEACDQAGRYVPRLCTFPRLGCACCTAAGRGQEDKPDANPEGCSAIEPAACGLCVVEVDGTGPTTAEARTVLACCSGVQPGIEVRTESPVLHAERLARLRDFLFGHPHICLSCPDRDGCTREECTFGIPREARCCDEFGRCEFGRLVGYVDAAAELPRRAVAVNRKAWSEGRIRREPGLCVGCGRCVAVCGSSQSAGKVLRMVATVEGSGTGRVAMPKEETLRASGCTFCGQCVMVCPTGAVTAPGEEGARWLEGWRRRTGLAEPVLPPDPWRPLTEEELAAVSTGPGVFLLAGAEGEVLRISGVADLASGIHYALGEQACSAAAWFRVEPAPLFTQRESELLARFARQEGRLPPGNGLSDDLFDDDLD